MTTQTLISRRQRSAMGLMLMLVAAVVMPVLYGMVAAVKDGAVAVYGMAVASYRGVRVFVAWRMTVLPGRAETSAATDLTIGIIMIAVDAIVGATMISPVITSLVSAGNVTGIDAAASGILPVAQLVTVVTLGVGILLGGLYFIFQAAKKGFGSS